MPNPRGLNCESCVTNSLIYGCEWWCEAMCLTSCPRATFWKWLAGMLPPTGRISLQVNSSHNVVTKATNWSGIIAILSLPAICCNGSQTKKKTSFSWCLLRLWITVKRNCQPTMDTLISSPITGLQGFVMNVSHLLPYRPIYNAIHFPLNHFRY